MCRLLLFTIKLKQKGGFGWSGGGNTGDDRVWQPFQCFYLLPAFAALYGMPLDAIVGIAHEINSNINSVGEVVLWAVVPFNLLKGGLLTVLNMLLYKRISPMIKGR